MENISTSVGKETEQELQEEIDCENPDEVLGHLEQALNETETEEVKYQIRQALQQILI